MSYYTYPAPFRGTAAERDANRLTHLMVADDDGARCHNCDAREGGTTADWPCGAEVPRLQGGTPGGDPGLAAVAENPWIDGGLSLGGL